MGEKGEKLQQIRNTEKIFMIEVVIQKVFLDVIELNDLGFRNAETCLQYRFLEYGPFKICEKDFKCKTEEGGCAGCSILKNGNSTMFPLFPEQIFDAKEHGFQLDVEVVKMFKAAPKTVGRTEVPMKDIFNAVFEQMIKKRVDACSKSMKNRYKLKDSAGDPVGYADLFIRFSSMGKVIVTKFQMDTAKECMEFQSNGGNTYKYQKHVFPDPYLCKPCGKPAKMFPPHERIEELPKDFPTFKLTDEMRTRLKSRRNQEMGLPEDPEPEPPARKSSVKKGGKAGKGAKSPAKPPPKPAAKPPPKPAAKPAPPAAGPKEEPAGVEAAAPPTPPPEEVTQEEPPAEES